MCTFWCTLLSGFRNFPSLNTLGNASQLLLLAAAEGGLPGTNLGSLHLASPGGFPGIPAQTLTI